MSTRQIAESVDATGMHQNGKAAQEGGRIAKGPRLSVEEKTGKKVVSKENCLPPVRGSKQLTELSKPMSENPDMGHPAHTLYTDDDKLTKLASDVQMKVVHSWELDLPDSPTPLLEGSGRPLDIG